MTIIDGLIYGVFVVAVCIIFWTVVEGLFRADD